MATPHTISATMIREVGEALFGAVWQGEMAKGLGVPRQSVAYYLKAGGVSGAQAAAIIGLVGRTALRETSAQRERQRTADARHETLLALMTRLEAL